HLLAQEVHQVLVILLCDSHVGILSGMNGGPRAGEVAQGPPARRHGSRGVDPPRSGAQWGGE
ncbi:hypothetical protein, partial [Sphingomonas sp.]|uniref:hypothetical protein n=1 Tax=Sphingomonas sp. TaxID=28214 RepID=UPI0035B3B001